MLWRKFKLDWTYALGELLIITVGVLIALAIDGWNNERIERGQERDSIARLISDIDDDLRRFEFQLQGIDRKEASLMRLKAAFVSAGPVDPARFLGDVVSAANFGWSQMLANRVTFDDLLESGRFALVEDPDMRALIASYYGASSQATVRIDERETAFPPLSYQLVPRGPASLSGNLVGDGGLQGDLDGDALEKIIAAVRQSPIESYVIAEINLARFIRGVTQGLRIQGTELVARLKAYQEDIG